MEAVREEGMKIPDGFSMLGMSEVLESIFGKYKTISTRDGKEYSGLLSENDTTYTITDVRLENEKLKILPSVLALMNSVPLRRRIPP